MDEKFNEQNSLKLIESMINRARNDFSESGTLYLVWGFVILVCGMVQFVAIHYYNSHFPSIWFLTWLVVIYQIIFLYRKRKTEKVKTYTADIVGYVWLVFTISLFIIVFILIYQKAYSSINPAILVIYGFPTILSGTILKFKPLVAGGISCWILAATSVFAHAEYQLLFLCAAVILAWIIPGFILRKKYLNNARNV